MAILHPLIINEARIFLFASTLRLCPFEKKSSINPGSPAIIFVMVMGMVSCYINKIEIMSQESFEGQSDYSFATSVTYVLPMIL